MTTIALLTSSYAPHFGGVESVVASVAAGLSANGETPLVITNRWPKALPARESIEHIPVLRDLFRVPAPSLRQFGGWAVHTRATRRRLVNEAREHGVGLVNVHCVSSNARYALSLARALDVPVVVSLHGELSGDATGAYSSAQMQRWWRKLIDAAAVVTAPSAHTLQCAEDFYGRPFAERGRVVPNGVDLDAFNRFPEPGVRRNVVAAGRLVSVKGFDVLLEAWSQAQLDPATEGHDLLIAGDGPERNALAEYAARLEIEHRVRFLGRLSPQELARAFRSAAVVAVPSREEAFGLTAVEAMAAGAPVVASRAGGLPEVLMEGAAGSLVPVNDAGAMASALTDILASQISSPPSMVEVAYRRAVDFSRERQLAALSACYRQALGDVRSEQTVS